MTLVSLPKQVILCRNFIGGQWQESAGKLIDIRSPYTGQVIGRVPQSPAADVNLAVDQAQAAFADWRATPIKERSRPLFRFRQLVLERIDELSHRAAAEAGKTVAEAQAGVLKGLEVAEFALSLQNLDTGGALEVSRGVVCQTTREPLGVVCGITPFNFPAMVPLWMFPIAITLGNCFVLKPSEKVPLTAQILAELMQQAGYPAGVFSLVNGTKETVEALVDNPHIQAVGFVGSTPVAKAVYARAAGHGKRALALGGAKNHLIVVPDADPQITVQGVLDSFTGCAGQRCMAASLLIAVGDVEPLLDQIKAAARELKVGSAMGAIIDKAAVERIEAIIARASRDGAQLAVDGRKPQIAISEYMEGNWLGPTVIDHARADMECARTEIFGPVLTIIRVKTLREALALENANEFGNATSVFTTSGAVARTVAHAASNGMVGINIGVPVPREPFSFGGTKASKFGQGDITGEPALDLWTNLKKVTAKWTNASDHNWMS